MDFTLYDLTLVNFDCMTSLHSYLVLFWSSNPRENIYLIIDDLCSNIWGGH